MIEAQKRNSNHDKSNRRYNTMTTYFINCKTLDELKKAYKAAAMKYHPDMAAIRPPCRRSMQSMKPGLRF